MEVGTHLCEDLVHTGTIKGVPTNQMPNGKLYKEYLEIVITAGGRSRKKGESDIDRFFIISNHH